MRFVGFDPGGINAFGWAVVEWMGTPPVLVGQGICSNAAEALAAAAFHLPDPPHGIGIDAPLFWVAHGDRAADQAVRALVVACGGHGGTVNHVNSLRGACLVQGVLVAILARARWPRVALTEAHPKALLAVCGAAHHFVDELVPEPFVEHTRDAALAAFSARSSHVGSAGWHDLAAVEVAPVFPAGTPIQYWFPEAPC